ncbi:hypothetical protein P43SY_002864 [Pythium insidiosum]|uniref:Uncharacterized protein n=1 Tax=Pythium insidiosum TaxID=114742 RepID=A0AAD5M8Y3_PYTIN|nr:hypothetical protein P43SY_002864 [Pythium insidiosum]
MGLLRRRAPVLALVLLLTLCSLITSALAAASPSKSTQEHDQSTPPPASSNQHEPVVSVELRVDAKASVEKSSEGDHRDMVARMAATLDALYARHESSDHTTERETISTLKKLLEQATPLMTAETLHAIPELYDQVADAHALLRDVVARVKSRRSTASAADADADSDKEEEDDDDDELVDGAGLAPEPSEAFLDLEERLHTEGPTSDIVDALQHLAHEESDWFAHEALAYIELFEPNPTQTRDFSRAFVHLRAAADAGLPSSSGTLAMLSLIDFWAPRDSTTSRDDRHRDAGQLLLELARKEDLMASLVVGYKTMTGAIASQWPGDSCSGAVLHYHRCAQSNVQQISENGGERSYDLVRLSEEFVAPGAINNELQEDAAQRLEYYRTLAANPGDELWAEATQRLAAEHFRRAADAGEPLAQANYGMMLANGIGVKQDNASALEYFERAAAQGSGFAMHGLGVMYLNGAGVEQNATKAVEYFEDAVEYGYVEAHTYLGTAYLHGNGVAVNESLAFEHFVEAATTESSLALFNLGVMYYRGVGTPPSCDQALQYFRRVAVNPALLGDMPFTMEKAYDCYRQGDYVRAYLQYRLLALTGSEEAQINAAFLVEHHSTQIFPPQSQDQLPPLWMTVPENPLTEAFQLYEQAAWLNDTEAIRKTGACHHDGWAGVCRQNHTKALKLYARAATLGDAEAAYKCGAMYSTGDGVVQDLNEASRFFSMCADAEFPDNAPCVLAQMATQIGAVTQALARRAASLLSLR